MTTASKTAVAALGLLVLLGAAWLLWDEESPARPTPPPTKVGSGGAPPVLQPRAGEPESGPSATPGAGAKPPAAPPVPAGRGALRVVRRQAGRDVPVAGARIRVVGPAAVLASLKTDGAGRVLLPPALLGSRRAVWVQAPDGVLLRRSVALVAGEVLLRLGPARKVSVHFVDGSGRLLAPEEVRRRYEAAGLEPVVTWVSDAALHDPDRLFVNLLGEQAGLRMDSRLRFAGDGIHVASAPTEGTWHLLVDRPGAGPDVSEVLDASVEQEQTVTLPLPAAAEVGVRMRLLSADERTPLAGAEVRPWFEFGDDAAFVPGAARHTDAAGEILIPRFDPRGRRRQRAPSWWFTTAERAALLDSWRVAQARAGEVVQVLAWRTCAVGGRAWKRDGTPAAGCHVTWVRKGYARTTTVDADGHYLLEGIPYTLPHVPLALVEALDLAAVQAADVPVKPGETSEFDIGRPQDAAVARGSLEVRLTWGGRPLAGALVLASPDPGSERGQMGRTGKDGRHRFEGLAPGTYKLHWALGDVRVSDDFGCRSTAPVKVAADETRTLDFDLPDGVLEVVVLDDATGKPIPGAGVGARPADPKLDRDRFDGFRLKLGWAERTGADGVVRLRALPRNVPLQLMCGAEGYPEAKREDVRAGDPDDPPRLTLRLRK